MKIQSPSNLIPYFRPLDQTSLLSVGIRELSTNQEPEQQRLPANSGQGGAQGHRYYLKSVMENDIYNAKRSVVLLEEAMKGRLIDVYA